MLCDGEPSHTKPGVNSPLLSHPAGVAYDRFAKLFQHIHSDIG